MKAYAAPWLCLDRHFDAHPESGVFSGVQLQTAAAIASPPQGADALGACWQALVRAAHDDLAACLALLGEGGAVASSGDVPARVALIERGCDRLAERAARVGADALLPRACVLSGLIGRLIRISYDAANVRKVRGQSMISYQLVCAKLADMVMADQIIALRLSTLFAPPLTDHEAQEQASRLRAVPQPDTADSLRAMLREAASVLERYVELNAGRAFIQREEEPPLLAVAQALIHGLLFALARRA